MLVKQVFALLLSVSLLFATRFRRIRISHAACAMLLMSSAPVFSQTATQPSFASAEQASDALFAAVRDNNEPRILSVLGEAKQLVASGDELEDKRDRALFVHKYEQMHRLVADPDGSRVLYIGAENWPFPVPLVPKNGRWYFDSEAGEQEIIFREVGENEATAIATCRALVVDNQQRVSRVSAHNSIEQYARALITAERQKAGNASAIDAASAPFHGYRSRVVLQQGTEGTKRRFLIVAYPVEYRSSG